MAQNTLGVKHLLHANADPAAQLAALTGGELANAVFEATGNPRAMDAIRARRIVSDALVTHRAALSEVSREFPGWLNHETGVIKALVKV